MITKTLTFKNYRGEEETESFMFNMSEGELVKLQVSAIDQKTESMQDKLDKISKGLQGKELVAVIDELVTMSYGVPSTDGKRFRKNAEILEEFTSSGAYSVLITELFSLDGSLAEFVNGVVPADVGARAAEKAKELTAREKSEAAMGGFKKKDSAPAPSVVHSPAEVQASLPEDLPASAPILETTQAFDHSHHAPPVSIETASDVDLRNMSHEELVKLAQRHNPIQGIQVQ